MGVATIIVKRWVIGDRKTGCTKVAPTPLLKYCSASAS